MRAAIVAALLVASGCYQASAAPASEPGISYMSLIASVYEAQEARCACDPSQCLPSAELTPSRVRCIETIDLGDSETRILRQADDMALYADCSLSCGKCSLPPEDFSGCTTQTCADEMLRIDRDAGDCLRLP